MKIDQVLEKNRKKTLKIAADHGARDVRIFGSLARGEASSTSDIDLLVELDSGRTLLDLIAVKQDLEDLFGCRVDVVTKAALSPYIREQVLKEAVPL